MVVVASGLSSGSVSEAATATANGMAEYLGDEVLLSQGFDQADVAHSGPNRSATPPRTALTPDPSS